MDGQLLSDADVGIAPSQPAPTSASTPSLPIPDDSNPIASLPMSYDQFQASKNNTPGFGNSQTAAPLLSDADVGLGLPEPNAGTLAESPFVGFNKGLAETVGAPVDLVNWGMKKLGLPVSNNPFMGSNYIENNILGSIGANPQTHVPLDTTERLLQGAGAGAASVMVPEAGVAALIPKLAEIAPETADFLSNTFGASKSVPAALVNSGVGAASGLGSATVDELPIPDEWRPLARLGAGFAGGIGGALGAQIPNMARQGIGTASNFFQPMMKEGPEAIAGARLATAAGGKDALQNAIEDNPGQLVPGSTPTLAEQTQIPGISALQHQVETQNGVPFQDRRAAQNQARVGALTGVQPTGSPEDVANLFRSQLAAIDQRAEAAVTQRTGAAQSAAGDLGGTQTPEFYGSQINNAVQPQVDAAVAGARSANQDLGDYAPPEQLGATMREGAQNVADQVRQERNALYQAIDPEGKLNVVAAPVRESASALAQSVDPLATPMSGEEASIFSAAQNLPNVIPFNSLTALDSRVSAAMSQEMRQAGRSPVWGRLSQLKDAISDAIGNAVENQVAYERGAVARGEIAPEDTAEARLAQQASDFVAAKRQSESASNGGEGPFWDGTGGSSPVSGTRGTTGKTNRRFGNPPGDQGISPPPLEPNFDQAAADRLSTAKQAHAAYVQTYKQGPIGNMLRTNGFAGQYKLIDSGVPDTVFVKGPKGFETATAFRQAVKDDPAAVSALRNYAAMTLRRVAERPDGTLDPAKFSAWKSAYGDALRAVPELRQKFANVQKASDELNKFSAFRKDLAPSAVPEMFFHSGATGADDVRQLRGLIGDQKATSVLTDYAASRLKQAAMRSDGTLDPAKTATWLKQHQSALGELPGLADRFSTVAKATKAIDEAAAVRKATTDAYQQGVVGKLLKVADPSDVTKTIGGIFGQKNAVGEMRRIVQQAKGNPDAEQGLRKAIVDHIYNNFVGNTENLKSDAFQTFLRKNKDVLGAVFKPQELKDMGAIAADLARTKIAFDQARIPNQSNTTPDRLAAEKANEESGHGHGHGMLGALSHGSLLGKMAMAGYAGMEAGEGKGAVLGVLAALGSHVIGAARGAGLEKADDLIKEALLNPTGDGALAKALLMKAPNRPNTGSAVTLAQQLRRIATINAGVASPANSDTSQQSIGRATGGRVIVDRNPSDAQKEAGNYRKHHMRFQGLDVTIENPKGSYRSGTDGDGKPWRVMLPHHYGYIKGTVGADGDHVDCYIGPDHSSDDVFVIDQKDLGSGKFDEHKVMLGFKSKPAAEIAYRKGFSDGKGHHRIMKVTHMTMEQFKEWLKTGATLKPTRKAA